MFLHHLFTPSRTYLIIAPRVIRPDQVVQVYVAILELYHPKLTLTASIRKDGQEYTNFQETIYTTTTRLMQMKV